MNGNLMKDNMIVEKTKHTLRTFAKFKYLYLLLLPLVVWYIIFCYLPMYGLTLAFKTFDYSKGILGSPWVGFDHFKSLIYDSGFMNALKNTLIISFSKLLITFPCPIILAVLLNEITRSKLKKIYQTVFTFPHFISWIVLGGIVANFFSQNGIFNQIVLLFGGASTSVMVDKDYFRSIIYISYIWKEVGWESIIYLAVLAGINPELFEAAEIDGANRFQKMLNITWPAIVGATSILLILNIGHIMSGVSFDQVFNLYSPPVYSVADTIDTYIYRETFTVGMDFGYATSIGFFKSVINLLLILTANTIVKRAGEEGLF